MTAPLASETSIRFHLGIDNANGRPEHSDITLLSRLVRRISASVTLDEVLRDVVDFLVSLVPCDSCMIYVLEGDELVLRTSMNPHPEIVGRLKMKLGQGITGWVAEHREPVVITQEAYKDPRSKLFSELPEDRFEAFLSVPLVSGGKLVGVINLQSRASHPYSEREIGLIATLGFLVGAEIERVRLEGENSFLLEKLETRSFIDRAKGILQFELKVSEETAYRTIQRESRQRRKSMKEIAEAIILSDDLKREAQQSLSDTHKGPRAISARV